MPLIPIDNVGTLGIIKDTDPADLPPEAWSSGQNVRFVDGFAQKFTGHKALGGAPSITPYHVLCAPQNTTVYWIYAGLTKVYATDFSTHSNITRQTASVDVDYTGNATVKWNGLVFNGLPILNNALDDPQVWNPPSLSQRLVALPNWPANTKAQMIRGFKNHLFAIDVTEAGTRYPQVVRWSHPADPGTVPSSWNYADATKDAGRVALADKPGYLKDLLALGGNAILYAEDRAYLVRYVGGNDIWSFDVIFPDWGILAAKCATGFPSGHFVVTQDDILVHNGTSERSLLTRRQRRSLFNAIEVSVKETSFTVTNFSKNECWFCYPEDGATQPTRALIWNWDTNTITERQLGAETAHIGIGVVVDAPAENWDADSQAWDLDTSAWDVRSYDPSYTQLLMARSQSAAALYNADNTEQFDATNITAYVERLALSLDGRDRQGSPKANPDLVKYVKRIVPRMDTTGPVNIYVGGQQTKDGAVTWTGPFSFDPTTQREILCDVVAPYIAVKFESTTNITWKLFGYGVDVSLVGRY